MANPYRPGDDFVPEELVANGYRTWLTLKDLVMILDLKNW